MTRQKKTPTHGVVTADGAQTGMHVFIVRSESAPASKDGTGSFS